MSLNRVLRSSLWLYASGIASSFLGYLYWLLASGFIPPSAIGDAAFIVSIVYLVATLIFGRATGSALSAFRCANVLIGPLPNT